MHSRKNHYLLFLSAFVFTFLSACSSNQHADTEHSATPDVYVASSNPMRNVQNALDEAKANNKHLLVVMGASWCHDSQGFATKFATPELAKVIDDNYELVYVDVGYFNDLRHISERFDQAHYFATPTVMIINAQSEKLMNASTMAQWGRADSIPYQQYVEYFTHYASLKTAPQQYLSSNHRAIIDDFKQSQGQRLVGAYAKLTPLMEEEDGEDDPSDEFIAKWREVRAYRTQLQLDIQELYDQARGEPSRNLKLPTYSSFSWE